MSLDQQSIVRLQGVHPNLVAVAERAAEKVEFRVLEGVRTLARQRQLYAQGRTAPGPIVTGTMNSKHRKQADGYGHAIDGFPAPYSWTDLPAFDKMIDAMFEAAEDLNVPIRSGADWDRDGNFRERGESDSPHFELVPGPVVPRLDSKPTLRIGARGPSVVALQQALAKDGRSPTLMVDGRFGPATDLAVKKFQTAKGLTVDGIVGPKTWTALNAEGA